MTKAGITEGVAYTFVTPEEGNELTRIEMRINRMLKRDEIKDFETVARPVAPRPPQQQLAADGTPADGNPAAEPEPRKPAPPKLGRGGRPPRRIRRAL